MLFTYNDRDYYVYEKLSAREAWQLSRRTHEYSLNELIVRYAGAIVAIILIVVVSQAYSQVQDIVFVVAVLCVAGHMTRLDIAKRDGLFESRRQRQQDILSRKAASESQISYQLLLGDHTSFLSELIAQEFGRESLSPQREQLIAQYFQHHRVDDGVRFYLAKCDGFGLHGDTASQTAIDARNIVMKHPEGQWDGVKYAEMVNDDRRKYVQFLTSQVDQLRREGDAGESRLRDAMSALGDQQRLLSGEQVHR